MIPAVGNVSGALSGTQLTLSNSGAGEPSVSPGERVGLGQAAAGSGTPAGGSEQAGSLGALEGAGGPEGPGGIEATGAAEAGGQGFGEALTTAISSLEQTQQNASNAAQALATGSVSNPESAIVTVEEAQLAMQLASQIRTKATEAAQQIFQTQV